MKVNRSLKLLVSLIITFIVSTALLKWANVSVNLQNGGKFTVKAANQTVNSMFKKHGVSCSKACLPCSSSEDLTCRDVLAKKTNLLDLKFNRKKFKRKVVMSSDTMNLFYAWFAPITSLMWYEMNWTPVVIFVESKSVGTDLEVFKFIMEQVEAAGGEVIRIWNTLPQPFYLAGMVTTTSRFAVCVEDWPEDTYVLTSDIDMWPLDKRAFDKHTSVSAAAHIFGDEKYPQFYACYNGMNVSTWREVVGFKKGDNILKVIAGMRKEHSRAHMSWQWSVDQEIFTKRMKNWHDYPHKVHFYGPRNFSTDRLDRSLGAAKFTYSPGQYLDSHVLRPGFNEHNWGQLRALAAHLLNEKQQIC